jgi:hypothetical protein
MRQLTVHESDEVAMVRYREAHPENTSSFAARDAAKKKKPRRRRKTRLASRQRSCMRNTVILYNY